MTDTRVIIYCAHVCVQCIITHVSVISAHVTALIYMLYRPYRLYQCFLRIAKITCAQRIITRVSIISAHLTALIYTLYRLYRLYQCFSRIAKNHMRTMYYNACINHISRVDICVISPVSTVSVLLALCKKSLSARSTDIVDTIAITHISTRRDVQIWRIRAL